MQDFRFKRKKRRSRQAPPFFDSIIFLPPLCRGFLSTASAGLACSVWWTIRTSYPIAKTHVMVLAIASATFSTTTTRHTSLRYLVGFSSMIRGWSCPFRICRRRGIYWGHNDLSSRINRGCDHNSTPSTARLANKRACLLPRGCISAFIEVYISILKKNEFLGSIEHVFRIFAFKFQIFNGL